MKLDSENIRNDITEKCIDANAVMERVTTIVDAVWTARPNIITNKIPATLEPLARNCLVEPGEPAPGTFATPAPIRYG